MVVAVLNTVLVAVLNTVEVLVLNAVLVLVLNTVLVVYTVVDGPSDASSVYKAILNVLPPLAEKLCTAFKTSLLKELQID